MLALRTNNYEFDNLISTEYMQIDRNFPVGANQIGTVGWIRSKHLEGAFAPLAFNEIGILNKTYGINNQEQLILARDTLINEFNILSDTRAAYIRIYTNNIENVLSVLDTTDLFRETPTGVQELYNKCMDQVRLREDVGRELNTVIRLTKSKHMAVLVTNYSDDNQASDAFLTLGLTPIIFPDWKDKFSLEEIEYFKVLVNRSQVKRIANQKAMEAYKAVTSSRKYKDLVMRMRLHSTVNNLVELQIREARNTITSAENQAEQYLEKYTEYKTKFYQAQDTLANLEQKREDTTQEILDALRIEGIVATEVVGSTDLDMTFVDYVKFYNVDEVECVCNGLDEDQWLYKFFFEVFVEQKYKLRILNRFYFSFRNNVDFRTPGQMDTGLLNRYNATYNPHTHFYNCLGDYKPQLANAQAKKDLLMFNNLALASTRSINFRDGAVINRWKETLLHDADRYYQNYSSRQVLDSKCLEDENGNSYSIYELYINPPRNNETANEPREIDVEEL